MTKAAAQRSLSRIVVLACLGISPWFCLAGQEDKPQATGYDQKVMVGPHHRILETKRTELNAQGQPEEKLDRVVQLQPGLNYWEDNQWKPSKELIENQGKGAIARYGQHQARFAANLNSRAPIQLRLGEGKVLRSQILALAYYDTATGWSVILGEVKDSVGEILPPRSVLYPDAFNGIKADVRYTWTKGGFEQDVILRQEPPDPETYGFDRETTRLEVLTEFIDPPNFKKEHHVIWEEKDLQKRSRRLEPDLVDETLQFEWLTMGVGNAYQLQPEDSPWGLKPVYLPGAEPSKEKFRVLKSWQADAEQGREFLVESIDFASVAGQMKQFPKAHGLGREATLGRKLPATRTDAAPGDERQIRLASRGLEGRGFVLDYVLVGGVSDFTFYSGTTYWVADFINLPGTVTIQGGAVIKYDASKALFFNGTINCQTSAGNLATFTSAHDNSYGETIPGSTGNPGANMSSWSIFVPYASSVDLHHLRIRYAGVGVLLMTGVNTVRDSYLQYCSTGVQFQNCTATLNNLVLCEVATPYSPSGTYTLNLGTITTDCGGGPPPPSGDDHGNTIGTATAVVPNSSTSGNIETVGDEDWFRVQVSSGGTLTAYTTGSTDTYGYLLDANGNTLAYNDDNPAPNFRFSYSVSSGTYYIRVKHYSSSGTGAYTLYSEFTGSGGSDDHGNSMGSATSMSPNASMSGNIDYAGDEDFFRVQVTSSGSFTAYTTGSTDTYGYLLDSNGNTLTYSDDNPHPNFRFTYTVSAGTYYVRLRHYSSSGTGAYTLDTEFSCTDCDNDGLPDAWETQYFGNLSHPANEDYDGDGLTNLQEYQVDTSPVAAYSNVTGKTDGQWDKDADSISNAGEFNLTHSDPNFAFSISAQARDGVAATTFALSATISGSTMYVTITDTTADQQYILFSTESLTEPRVWKVEKIVAGADGQTQTTIQMLSRPMLYVVGGTTLDSDGDGLPDAYEALITKTVYDADGGSLDGDADLDGDGLRNVAEYLLRSNPLQSDNPLVLPGYSGGSVVRGELVFNTSIDSSNGNIVDVGLYDVDDGFIVDGASVEVGANGKYVIRWNTQYTDRCYPDSDYMTSLSLGAMPGLAVGTV